MRLKYWANAEHALKFIKSMLSMRLKVPKREKFVTELFTLSDLDRWHEDWTKKTICVKC
jgi:hypothetical protein